MQQAHKACFKVGDAVTFVMGAHRARGVVIEDRGPLRAGGRRLYRLQVDVAPAPSRGKGLNYGWSTMEGKHCVTSGCNETGITQPVIDYQHINGACDVQGGYVYRGTRVTQLIGYYLYADYCSGLVGGFKYAGSLTAPSRDFTAFISPGAGVVSFGEDARGELYLMTYGGTLYRIVP